MDRDKTQEQIDALTKPSAMYRIKDEDLEAFYTLMDSGRDKPSLSKYHLWKWIASLFPDATDGDWYIKQTDPFHVYIVNGIPEVRDVAADIAKLLARSGSSGEGL